MPVQLPFSKYYNSTLLLEYSEPFINKFALKLATSVNDTTRVDEFKNYIRFFDNLRNTNQFQAYVRNNPGIFSRGGSPISDPKNIDLFNAHQLEHINDIFNPEAKKKKEETEEQQPITKDADIVYPEDKDVTKTIRKVNPSAVNDKKYLEVYCAGNQEKCTKFSHDIFGQSYGFCIGRREGNLYDTYRYQQSTLASGGPRTFYFVRDYSRPATDELHLIVVHALENGGFTFTNAPNTNGDKYVGSFANLVAEQPKLAGLEELFKFIPYTEEELEYKIIKHLDASKFQTLTPRLKRVYLSSGKILPAHYFTQLTTEEQSINLVSLATNHSLFKLGSYGPGWGAHEFRNEYAYVLKEMHNTALQHADSGVKELLEIPQVNHNFVMSSLLLLHLNTDFYFTNNGEAKHRENKRNQPLKYFINNVLKQGQNHINGDRVKEILAHGYKNTLEITSIAMKLNGNTGNYDSQQIFSSITVGNSIVLIVNIPDGEQVKYNERRNAWSQYLIILDSTTGKVTHKIAKILSLSKHGFLVKDNEHPAPFLISFNGEEFLYNHEYDQEQVVADENYTGNIPYEEFISYSKQMQTALALKRLKHACKDLNETPAEQTWTINQLFDCIIKQSDTFETSVINDLSKDADISSPLLKKHGGYQRLLPTPLNNIKNTYKICKDLGGEVFEYYMQHMHPKYIETLEIELEKYSHNTLLANGLIMKYTTQLDKEVIIIDYKNYKIKVMGHILMFTKKSVIISEKGSIKNFKNAIGVDKKTLALLPDETLQKIENTFKSILKLKGNEAADVIATTYIDYAVNGRILSEIAKKTGVRLGAGTKFPPYDSIKKGPTFGPNSIVINTQNNPALQEKYSKFITNNGSQAFINAYNQTIKMLKSVAGIELALVIIKPDSDWNAGQRFDIGFIFAKNGRLLDTPANIKSATKDNSIYMELRRASLFVRGSKHNSPLLDVKNSFFSDENVLSFTSPRHINCYSRVTPRIRTQKITLDKFIGVAANAVYKVGMLNALGAIFPPITPSEYVNHHSRLNLAMPRESAEIPFGLFYKLFS